MITEWKSCSIKKATIDDSGTFKFLVSTASEDRDGEVVEPPGLKLSGRVPIYLDHQHLMEKMVATAMPSLVDGNIEIDGKFLDNYWAQQMRKMAKDPDHSQALKMSIGFINAKRTMVDGVPHVTEGDLVEVSFTGIPSNTDTQLLAAKSAGRPLETSAKSIAGSYEALAMSVVEALRSVDDGFPSPVATFPDSIVYETLSADGQWITARRTYQIDGNGIVSLGDPEAVTVETVVTPTKNVAVVADAPKPDVKSASAESAMTAAAATALQADAVLALMRARHTNQFQPS
jgi:hypothetical protein